MFHDTLTLLAYALCGAAVICFGIAGIGYLVGRGRSQPNSNTPPAAAPTLLATPSAADEKLCAELAVLAWKASKAARGNQARPLERSLERMLSRLQECGFSLAEYKGQRIFPGSYVKVLDTADGPEDVVLEDLEPEIVRHKKLLHPALVIIGKETKP